MNVKHYYNQKYQSFYMKFNDYALIRLYKKYDISLIIVLKSKYNQQYVDSFKIFEKIEYFVYKLKFSTHWRIHLVLFVVQLESILDSTTNFFARSRSNQSNFVFVKKKIDQMKLFEIERLINKRQTTWRESKYFVRWREYALQYDKWKNFLELNDAFDLIREYEKIIKSFITILDRLKLFNVSSIKKQKFFINTFVFSRKRNFMTISFNQTIISFKQNFVIVISRKFFVKNFLTFVKSSFVPFIVIVFDISLSSIFFVKNFFANFAMKFIVVASIFFIKIFLTKLFVIIKLFVVILSFIIVKSNVTTSTILTSWKFFANIFFLINSIFASFIVFDIKTLIQRFARLKKKKNIITRRCRFF